MTTNRRAFLPDTIASLRERDSNPPEEQIGFVGLLTNAERAGRSGITPSRATAPMRGRGPESGRRLFLREICGRQNVRLASLGRGHVLRPNHMQNHCLLVHFCI